MTTFQRVAGVFLISVGVGGLAVGWSYILSAAEAPWYWGLVGFMQLGVYGFALYAGVGCIENEAGE